MDKYNMVLPRITYSGVDALENLRRVVAGCKKAAIFTDKGIGTMVHADDDAERGTKA